MGLLCGYYEPMAKKISVRIQLDSDLLMWVKREATKRHCSMSQVVRDLIVGRRNQKDNK